MNADNPTSVKLPADLNGQEAALVVWALMDYAQRRSPAVKATCERIIAKLKATYADERR